MANRRGWLLATLSALALLPPETALAQSSESAEAGNDIVVTARKREERLQDVPESVSVLSGDLLDRANISTIHGVATLTPNMLVRSTFRSNETFITMRGISSAQRALPPVSVIIDGVQVGSNDFINQDLQDIERIEILRGPQGALYGQGAIAGAINIITRRPTNDMKGFLKGSFGNGTSVRVAGAVSGALVPDTLLFRISGYHRGTDGLISNVRDEKVDSGYESSIRGQLLLTKGDLEVALRGSWTGGKEGCCLQDKAPRDSAGNFVDLDDVTNPGPSSNILGRQDTQFHDQSARIDYDFGPVQFTAITGLAYVTQDVFADLDYTAVPVSIQDLTYTTRVFNQDLRLTSTGTGPFQWIIGAFYQNRREYNRLQAGADNGVLPITPSLLNQQLRTRNRAIAGYGQASYSITDSLELLGALRYDKVKADNVDELRPSTTEAEASYSAFQPKVQLSWHWTPDVMLYATYSQGFRTGGFSQSTRYDDETTYNYEVGFKTQMMDGLLTINGSAFHIDYRNQLLSYGVTTNTTLIRRTINIPKTRNDGFELEIQARPSQRLTAGFTVGYTDSVIVEVSPDPYIPTAGAIGKNSPLVPPFTMSGNVTYRAPLGNDMELIAYGAVQHRGGFYFDVANAFYTQTKTFVDANLTLEKGGWSIGLFGKNLTDARFVEHISITGADLRVPNRPRTYGIEAGFRF